MTYRYSFTNTTKDLLDAHDAHTPRARGVRRLLRLFLIMVGLFWVYRPIWLFFTGSPEFDSKKVLMWLGGCAILWVNLIWPLLERRKLKRDTLPELEVIIEFGNDAISIQPSNTPTFVRSYEEVADMVPCKKGMLISFTDDQVNWLPKRVFKNELEMKLLQKFIDIKIRQQKA